MRRASIVGLFTCVASLLVGFEAGAQQKPAPEAPKNTFKLRRDNLGSADAEAGRARARAGDCAGALPAFDAALRTSEDPSIHRDRGLCHEKLGNPFPAIDDYRFYVTNRPDAPDTDQIRQRLIALEQSSGTPHVSSSSGREDQAADGYGGQGPASKSTGSGNMTDDTSGDHRGSNVVGPKQGEASKGYDYYVEQEKIIDAADKSPLRYGSGLVLGAFINMPRFFVGDGASKDLAYGAGLAVRYSTGRVLSVIGELGFAGIGKSGEPSSQSAPRLMLGLEGRFAVSKLAGDHILLRGGIDWERYVVSGSRFVSNYAGAQLGVGYRHVFGSSIALEALAVGGPVYVSPESGDGRVDGVIGATAAFVVGF